MAELIKLKVNKKTDQKPNFTRRAGLIPAVLYGPGLPEGQSIPMELPENEFIRAYRVAGTSTLIELDMDGEKYETLIQDFARHPISDRIIHVDFLAIKRGEKLTVSVPLEFVGESGAVKLGGILNTPIDEIEMRVLPKDLLAEIKVDISKLDSCEDVVTLADLGLDPEKFELDMPLDTVLASVAEQEEEKEEEPIPAEGEVAMPEITSQKGEEEEGSEGEGKKEEEKGDKDKE